MYKKVFSVTSQRNWVIIRKFNRLRILFLHEHTWVFSKLKTGFVFARHLINELLSMSKKTTYCVFAQRLNPKHLGQCQKLNRLYFCSELEFKAVESLSKIKPITFFAQR
jgi:hypothetical protein